MAHARPRRRNRNSSATSRPIRRPRLFETLECRTMLTGPSQEVWVSGAWLDAGTHTPASLTPGESVTDNVVTKIYGTDAFSTVQAGASAAAAGGAVHVDPGLYVEDVNVGNNLTIEASGGGPSVLQSQSGGAAITVESGFSVSLVGLEFQDSLFGIRVDGGAATIDGATVSGNTYGIYVTGGSAAIANSLIVDNSTGVRFAGGATGLLSANNFAGGVSPNNSTDLLLASTAGAVTIAAGNAFAGATTIDNQTNHAVDATAANSFAGVNLADLDPATTNGLVGLYSIVDHVADGLDRNGSGLVRLKAGNVFLAASSETRRNSLQRAVNLASANDTIFVQAGTYVAATHFLDTAAGLVVELNIDKPLSLVGPNADFDPLTNPVPAHPQAVILPGTSNPDPGDSIAVSVVGVRADHVTIRGLTIDGANPALTGDPHTVVYNGAAIDALDGISCLAGVGNLTFDHNVVRNASYTGIDLENGSGAAGTSNSVVHNLISNIGGAAPGFGTGVFLANNFYAAVVDNVIDTALLGVQTQSFTASNPGGPGTAQISDNSIAAVGSGIWYNDFSATASPFDVSGNTITAVEDSASLGRWVGILITSQVAAIAASFTNNSIDGSATAANPSQISYGVDVSDGSATLIGSLIKNSGTGIYTHDGGSLTVTSNSILANTTGIDIADAALISATNNIISGGQIGIEIGAAAASVGTIGGGSGLSNSISGNSTVGLRNDSGLAIDASGNWWGSADGPNSAANTYHPNNPAGDAIAGADVTIAAWLADGTDTAPAQNGFQPTTLDSDLPTFSSQAGQAATEGITQSIDLGSFNDADNAGGGAWHVTVDWGDGGPLENVDATSAGSLGTRSHTFTGEGHYTVAITIVEQAGPSGSTTFDVNVADDVPFVTATSATVSSAENALAHNSGTYGDYDDTVSVTGLGVVDNHDGTWSWSGAGDEDHPYDVTVTATNAHGTQSVTTFHVSFTDVPPTVFAHNGSVSAVENVLAHNSGTYGDNDDAVGVAGPGVVDNHDGTWSWSGDGDEDTPYDVTVTATNSHGLQSVTTFHVSFTDAPPTDAAGNASASAPENALAHNSGTYGDYDDAVSVAGPGVIDNHDGTWSWSGSGDEESPYDVTVTATNSHGSQSFVTFHVSFTDIPPTVTVNNDSVSAAENAVAHNSGTYGDYDDAVSVAGPGVVDNHDGTWSWSGSGDEDSPYDVTVTATNSHGSQSITTFHVSFTDVLPTVAANSSSVSAAENALAHNSGTYGDYDDVVSVAGLGVVDNHDGTWAWSGTGDEDSPYDVTVTATNSHGSQSVTSFHVSFTDVPPTVTAASLSVTAVEGSLAHNSGTYGDYDDAVGVAGPGVIDNHDGTWSSSGAGEENLPYDVTVTATNSHAAQSSVVFHVSFTDAPLTGSSTATAGGTEGATGSSVLAGATFTDANPGDHTADFTASVHWGDNSNSPGTVSYAGGVYTVSGLHTYAEEGTFNISIDVVDAGGSATVITGVATVTDPNVVASGGFLVHAEIQTSSGLQTVATFTDPGGPEDPNADYSAAIDWGDNTGPTAGVISYDAGQGIFVVRGSHTWASPNAATYQITVAVHHAATAMQTVTSTASVASLSLDLSGSPAPVNEAAAFTLVLGAIHDSNPTEADEITDYDIDWGDGSPIESFAASGTWTAGLNSKLHTYSDGPAAWTIHVSLHDASGLRPNVGSLGVTVLNVAPTGTLVNFGSVSEGSAGFVSLGSPHDASAVDQGAGFTFRYDFDNDGTFDFTTTAAGQLVTVPASYFPLGPANRVVRGRVSDKDGGFADYTTTIHVNNVAPIVSVAGDLTIDQGVTFTKPGSFADPGSDSWTAQVNYGDGSGWQPLAVAANKTFTLSHGYASAAGSPYLVSVQVTDHGGAGPGALAGTGTFHVTVTEPPPPPTFQITSFAGNASGFDVVLSRPVDVSRLNLYGGAVGALGPADVTVTNQQTGAAVRGSLVWESATNTAHFVATGGPIAPGNYTVVLASRSDGWTDANGSPLDGLGTGVAGSGNFTRVFTVAAPSVPVLSLPDFARGPGQSVDVNLDGTARSPYLPVRVSDTAGLRSLSFEIDYDPSLLNVTGVLKAAGLPADWSVSWQVTNSGDGAQLTVTASGTTALAAGAREVVDIVAQIPSGAAYRAAQLLKPINVSLNSGAIGVLVDEAVQKVAYFGDATGDSTFSGLDASFISRNVVLADDGFSAYPLTDPRIIGDVTGDGTISGLDASTVANANVGNSQPTIPAIPAHAAPANAAVDPTVTVPLAYANPGGTVMVPINISEVNGLQSVDLAFSYSSGAVTIAAADVTLAGPLAADGWSITKNLNTPGLIRISSYGFGPIAASGPGTILNLTFHVPMSTGSGSYPVGVITDPIPPSQVSSSRLNEGQLTLSTVNGSVVVADPLTVVNTGDDGVGSLRHVIQYANGLSGTSHTITFAIPAGPQTINLLSPLPASTVPLTVVLDASQNVVVNSPSGGGRNNYSALTKIGAGSLTIAGANNLTGNVEVSDGTLRFDVSTAPTLAGGFRPTVDNTGTLELAGSMSALTGGSGGTKIVNNSTAVSGVLVTGSGQHAGGIDGTGILAIAADGSLTANHVVQGALAIGGSAGHAATLTIAASDSSGNPLAVGQASQPDKVAASASQLPDATKIPSPATPTPVRPLIAADESPAVTKHYSMISSKAAAHVRLESLTYGIAEVGHAFAGTTTVRRAATIDQSLLELLAGDRPRPHRGRRVAGAASADQAPLKAMVSAVGNMSE